MTFKLQEDWDKIKDLQCSFDWFEKKWVYDWTLDQSNASIMYHAIKRLRPKVALETGTFEGHGTYVIAKALNELGSQSLLYTIDYDGDPLTKLEDYHWKELKKIRDENLSTIQKKFSNVEVLFLNGDSRELLPKLFKKGGLVWDFFYQDSMHFEEGVQAEWDAVKNFANKNAVAVFDDISLTSVDFEQNGIEFCRNFLKSEDCDRWNFLSTDIGHHQFWIQKKS